jgi:hypothetical protein
MNEGKSPNCQAAADRVREKSKAGQLASAEEVLLSLQGGKDGARPDAAQDAALAISLLNSMVAENKDLKEIRTRGGTSFYYSCAFMGEEYARLLLRRGEGALPVIADLVRDDSERYPRPTPLAIFEEPPFDLNTEQIHSCLQEMSGREEYQDISQVSTSLGHVFLYSSKRLDRDYALMLAEWIDVGQFENP